MRKVIPFAAAALALMYILNSCTNDKASVIAPTCDTTTVRLSVELNEILSNNCYSCHSGASPISGINLADYNVLKTYASNGILISAITHTGSVEPMPQGGNKLSDCEIDKFRAWINRGTLNN